MGVWTCMGCRVYSTFQIEEGADAIQRRARCAARFFHGGSRPYWGAARVQGVTQRIAERSGCDI